METPIYTRLSDYHKKNRISFAMPGHKNLRGLSPDLQKCDVTELTATADLHHEDKSVQRANELLSRLYGSRYSYIMTGGSTAGVQAMISSVLKPGDTLLASADCHMSVINTCALCGFRLRLIPVSLDREYGIPAGIEDFEIDKDIKAVLVTSPDYYGRVKDIASIAEKCHMSGIPLLVDEAHGAHFIADTSFPETAVRLGADAVCQSAHKTLNALTGAAYLHICSDRMSRTRVKRALASFQSSSPSYPIAASADAARAVLAEADYKGIIKECMEFKAALCKATGIRFPENDDPTRLVLSFAGYSTTGFEVSERLSSYYGIDVEMSDLYNVVLIVTPWNTHGDFMELFRALRDITGAMTVRDSIYPDIPPVFSETVDLSEGWYAETELVDIDSACGRKAASVVSSYPPGTGIIITGAAITKEQTDYIKRLISAGAEIAGLIDNKIEVVR